MAQWITSFARSPRSTCLAGSEMAAILGWFRFSSGYNSGAGAFSLGTGERALKERSFGWQ